MPIFVSSIVEKMDQDVLFYILLLLWLTPFSFGASSSLNVCMDASLHKKTPSPESELYAQCIPWKNRSCCTSNTTKSVHGRSHYNFNLNHCSHIKDISPECRRRFIQDTCFYECSPNVGPWLVKVSNMKIRNERFYRVPLCRKDCEEWFADCRYDYTCSSNWMRGWNWTNAGNVCSNKSQCLTFQDVFTNATNFCEKIWDESWTVPLVDDTPCMTLSFDGDKGNPNDDVALFYSHYRNSASLKHTVSALTMVAVLLSIGLR